MTLIGAAPTLSWIEAFTTAALTGAAPRWTDTANLWEQSFTQLARDVLRPGRAEWTGDGAEAAQDSTDKAAMAARGASNQLRDAADIATFGADQLDGLHAKSVAAIAETRSNGFKVNEDLSVTDNRRVPSGSSEYASHQVQAEAHAETIKSYARQLLALDARYATRLEAVTTGLDTLTLDTPGGDALTANDYNGIQLVNFFEPKQAPIPEPGVPDDPAGRGNGPSAADIRSVLERLPQGDRPWIREVRTPEDLQRLWKWMEQNGIENPNRYGDSSKGVWKDLPDGTGVGQRKSAGSTKAPALDINLSNTDHWKVHINPSTGGIPEIPATPRPSIGAEPGRGSGPGAVPPAVAESPADPRAPAVPGGPLGGGPIPDGTLPYPVEPPGPDAGGSDLPVIGDGKPDNPEV